jgi:hypothetical protein
MKRMESRFSGTCGACSVRFPRGTLIDYDRSGPRGRKASHADCDAPASSHREHAEANPIIEIITSGGSFTQRRYGRCEDAPCCGCCTF